MVKAIIADDEPAAIEVIKELAAELTPDIEILAMATDGLETIRLIHEQKPDLVLIDVNMPVLDGVQVIEKIQSQEFETIFTTGSAEYALKALKLNAVDYLLKPIDPVDFVTAINKARTRINQTYSLVAPVTRMQSATQYGIIYIDERNILHIKGMGSYSEISMENGKKIVVSKSIGQLEEKITSQRFYRCHSSHLVNVDFITQFISKDGYFVLLTDGSQVDVSRRNKEGLLSRLSKETK